MCKLYANGHAFLYMKKHFDEKPEPAPVVAEIQFMLF